MEPMKIIPGNAQHQGAREEQQDAFGFSDIEDFEFVRHGGVLAVVADGMGGHRMGREAARLAVQIMLEEYMAKMSDESIPDALYRSLYSANDAVYEMALASNADGDAGTTISTAVVADGNLVWASVGDSRLYLYRKGELTQLSRDHVFAADLAQDVADGTITQEEADNHPEREALTSFLGMSEIERIDMCDTPFPLLTGDLILLCTDGLYGSITEEQIIAAIADNPQQTADQLIECVLAQSRKYQDNTSVAVMKILLPEQKDASYTPVTSPDSSGISSPPPKDKKVYPPVNTPENPTVTQRSPGKVLFDDHEITVKQRKPKIEKSPFSPSPSEPPPSSGENTDEIQVIDPLLEPPPQDIPAVSESSEESIAPTTLSEELPPPFEPTDEFAKTITLRRPSEPDEPSSIADPPPEIAPDSASEAPLKPSASPINWILGLVMVLFLLISIGLLILNHAFKTRSASVPTQGALKSTLSLKDPNVMQFGQVMIDSSPMEADIYIRNQKKGQTPLLIGKLLPGRHPIELRKKGFAPLTREVTIQPHKTVKLSIQLSPLGTAKKDAVPEKSEKTAQAVIPSPKEPPMEEHHPPLKKDSPPPAPKDKHKDQIESLPPQTDTIKPGSTFENIFGMSFVYIPAGKFDMGSPPNEPMRSMDEKLHSVTLSHGYFIQTTEVTQQQWKKIMGNNPSVFKKNSENHPADNISWDMAQQFIRKLNTLEKKSGYRLPTEAEWEYACRAGTNTPFALGNCLNADQANYDGNYPYANCEKGTYHEKTTPVKNFVPNPWGLFDMHGNVWEWCLDKYEAYPSHDVTDPLGAATADHVLRGGSWYNLAERCRCATRNKQKPHTKNWSYGFRVVYVPI